MGGSMKGHTHPQSRGRPYGLMLAVAFVAATFGVVLLHKFRERRVLNLLVREKDRQLSSLHLLLQRERDYSKEAKRKSAEMKAKIYSLRTQKMDLNHKIQELQSTLSSLKEEQKAMESAFYEKQNEIKLLREKEMVSNKDDPHFTTLSKILRLKEAEIEDLKHRLELPVNVLSASNETNDPSKPLVNPNTKVSIVREDETDVHESNEKSGGIYKPVNIGVDKNTMADTNGIGIESVHSKDGEDSRGSTFHIAERKEMAREEQTQKVDNYQDNGFGHGSTSGESSIHYGKAKGTDQSQDGVDLGERKEESSKDETEKSLNNGVEVRKPRDDDTDGKVASSSEGDNQERGVNLRGGMKLEVQRKYGNGTSYRLRGDPAHIRKAKGKRWRIIARNNGATSTRGKSVFKDALESERNKRITELETQELIKNQDLNVGLNRNESSQEDHKLGLPAAIQQGKGLNSNINRQDGSEHRNEKSDLDGERILNDRENTESTLVIQKAVASADVKDYKRAENTSIVVQNADIQQQVEKRATGEGSEVPSSKTVTDEGSEVTGDTTAQKQATATQDVETVSSGSKQARVADKYEKPEGVQDIHESSAGTFRQPGSKMEEDEEDYKEEADEAEF